MFCILGTKVVLFCDLYKGICCEYEKKAVTLQGFLVEGCVAHSRLQLSVVRIIGESSGIRR